MNASMFRSRDWFIIGPLVAVGLALGFWGFEICAAQCQVGSPLSAFFKAFGLIKATGNFTLGKDPWQLVIAQFLVPLSFLAGGVKLVLQNLRRDMRVALARRQRGHVIVCGLGDTGRQVMEGLRNDKQRVVAITLDSDGPNALAAEARGVAVLKGDAVQPNMLKLAGLAHARALVIATGSDGTNIEIGLRAREFRDALAGNRDSITILPELSSEWLYDEVLTHRAATLGSQAAEFRLFNLNADAARLLLRAPAFRARSDEPATPYLAIAGFGQMASEFLLQAARSNYALPGQRLSIGVLDKRGEESLTTFKTRFPELAAMLEISCTPCSFIAGDASATAAIEKVLDHPNLRAAIVTLKEDDAALHTAIEMRKCLDRSGRYGVPVFVRLRQQERLGVFMERIESDSLLPNRLSPFGSLADLAHPDRLFGQSLDTLARAAHEMYLKDAPPGQASSVAWDRLPERFKQSNRAFTDHIQTKLNALGMRLVPLKGERIAFTEAEIEKLAEMEHYRWSIAQRAAGWRHGTLRNDYLRQHPLLVDWEALPESAKAGNRDMVRGIPAIAELAGHSIRRDRILKADGGTMAKLDALAPGEHAVILADGRDAAAWDIAQMGRDTYGATIRVIWREGTPPPVIPGGGAAGAVEGWIGEAELARLSA